MNIRIVIIISACVAYSSASYSMYKKLNGEMSETHKAISVSGLQRQEDTYNEGMKLVSKLGWENIGKLMIDCAAWGTHRKPDDGAVSVQFYWPAVCKTAEIAYEEKRYEKACKSLYSWISFFNSSLEKEVDERMRSLGEKLLEACPDLPDFISCEIISLIKEDSAESRKKACSKLIPLYDTCDGEFFYYNTMVRSLIDLQGNDTESRLLRAIGFTLFAGSQADHHERAETCRKAVKDLEAIDPAGLDPIFQAGYRKCLGHNYHRISSLIFLINEDALNEEALAYHEKASQEGDVDAILYDHMVAVREGLQNGKDVRGELKEVERIANEYDKDSARLFLGSTYSGDFIGPDSSLLDADKAESFVRDLVAENNKDALLIMGNVWAAREDDEKTIYYFNRAYDAGNPSAALSLFLSYFSQKKYEQACRYATLMSEKDKQQFGLEYLSALSKVSSVDTDLEDVVRYACRSIELLSEKLIRKSTVAVIYEFFLQGDHLKERKYVDCFSQFVQALNTKGIDINVLSVD